MSEVSSSRCLLMLFTDVVDISTTKQKPRERKKIREDKRNTNMEIICKSTFTFSIFVVDVVVVLLLEENTTTPETK